MATKTATAWSKTSVNGYLVGVSDEVGANASTADNMVSYRITEDLAAKKVLVGIQPTVAFAGAVTPTISVEGSFDGTNWVELGKATLAVVDNTNLQVAQIDLSSAQAPYYRVCFNKATTVVNVGTSGKLKFYYSVK